MVCASAKHGMCVQHSCAGADDGRIRFKPTETSDGGIALECADVCSPSSNLNYASHAGKSGLDQAIGTCISQQQWRGYSEDQLARLHITTVREREQPRVLTPACDRGLFHCKCRIGGEQCVFKTEAAELARLNCTNVHLIAWSSPSRFAPVPPHSVLVSGTMVDRVPHAWSSSQYSVPPPLGDSWMLAKQRFTPEQLHTRCAPVQ